MNHIYRVIFNYAKGLYQVASEVAKSSSGRSSTTVNDSTSHPSTPARSFKLLSYSMLGLGAGLSFGNNALANNCTDSSTPYSYCFIGASGTGVGEWGDTGGWQRPDGTRNQNVGGIKIDKLLLTGPDSVLTIHNVMRNATNSANADPVADLTIEKGARLIWDPIPFTTGTAIGRSYKGSIHMSGTADQVSTIELNSILTGTLRSGLSMVNLGDYSRIYVNNLINNPNEIPSSGTIPLQTVFTQSGIALNGRHIFFDAVANSGLIFSTNYFTANQPSLTTDPTLDGSGNPTRIMYINQGDQCVGIDNCATPNTGTIALPGDFALRIKEWRIYGGTLKGSSATSFGMDPNTTGKDGFAQFSFILNPNTDVPLAKFNGMNSARIIFTDNESSSYNSIFIQNANTVGQLYYVRSGGTGPQPYRINGDVWGDGSLALDSDYAQEATYSLTGKISHKGATYIGANNWALFGEYYNGQSPQASSIQSFIDAPGNMYVTIGNQIKFYVDNTFNGDIAYDTSNLESEAERASGVFVPAYISLGNRESAEALPDFPMVFNGYTDKDIVIDLLNASTTFNVGFKPSSDPFAVSLQDGVQGAKRMVVPSTGSNELQYVASQAKIALSEFESPNTYDLTPYNLTPSSSAADWQYAIDTEAAAGRTMGQGSRFTYNVNSLIGAPGVVDDSNDEVLFMGSLLQSYEGSPSLSSLQSPYNSRIVSINSNFTKTGDGSLVFTNHEFNKYWDYQYGGEGHLQLNFEVKAGTVDWRLNAPYTAGVDPVNPNVMYLNGEFKVAGGATVAISNAQTFLHIEQTNAHILHNVTAEEPPAGVYMPHSGDFILAGVPHLGAEYDSSNPAEVALNAQRATLSIIAGGGQLAEVYAEGKANIKGALLQIQGVAGTQDPATIAKSSDLADSDFTVIHTSKGFVGGAFDGGNNADAVFANNNRPAAFVDYLTGGLGAIYDCYGTTFCLISNTSADAHGLTDSSLTAQEYILKGLELSWNYAGTLPSITGNFSIANNDTFEVDTVLADRTDAHPAKVGGVYVSDYGNWDGKTLTKKEGGTLYLSAANTYTGNTIIEQGTISIAKDESLGASTGAVYLGEASNGLGSTLRLEPAPPQASTLPSGVAPLTGGLNTGNTLDTNRNFILGSREDNAIDVVRAADTYTIHGNISTNPSDGPDASGLIKKGQGKLVIAPDAGKTIHYDGDTQVLAGQLTIANASGDDLSGMTGNFHNSALLEFNTANGNVTIAGDVLGPKPLPVASEEESTPSTFGFTPATTLGSSYTIKSGNNTLTLNGNSAQNWHVQAGELYTTAESFLGNVVLENNTTMTFYQASLPLSIYNGILQGTASSTLQVLGNGGLDFQYGNGSQVGNVLVGNGSDTATFEISGTTTGSVPDPFHVLGNYTTDTGATSKIANINGYMKIDGLFTQKAGAHLSVVLDLNNINTADIIAGNANLNGSVAIGGFARVLCSNTIIGCDLITPNGNVVKASQLSGIMYPLVQVVSGGTITVDPSLVSSRPGDPSLSHLLNNSFLVFGGSVQNAGFNSGILDPLAGDTYVIDNPELAWLYTQDPNLQNGTFDIIDQGGFNIDVPIYDQPGSGITGGPNNNWDGTTLTKKGGGLLILSYNPKATPALPGINNGYTGGTIIEGGTIILQDNDDIIANSNEVVISDNSHLQIGLKPNPSSPGDYIGSDQTIQNLQTNPSSPQGGGGSSIDFLNTPPGGGTVDGGTITLKNTEDTTFGGGITGNGNINFENGPDNTLTLTGNLTQFKGNKPTDPSLTLTTGNVTLDGSKTYDPNAPITDKGCASLTCIAGNIVAENGTTLTLTNGGGLIGNGTNINPGGINPALPNDQMGMQLDELQLNNGGTIGFAPPADDSTPGRDLVINHLKGSQNPSKPGNIILSTQLGEDDSPTDKVVLTGSVDGTTSLVIRNSGGKGGRTTEGIKVVDASSNGVSTTEDNFTLNSPRKNANGSYITAGAFDYYLYRGDTAGAGDDWYLRSQENGFSSAATLGMTLASTSNRYGLATLGTYHDRVGAYTDTMRSEPDQLDDTVWARGFGEAGKERNNDSARPNYNFDFYALQFGADVYEDTNDENLTEVAGGYITLGRASTRVDKNTGDSAGKVTMNNFSVGAYYSRTPDDRSYFDGVVQLTRSYDIKATTPEGDESKNGAWNLAISGEVGYPWELNEDWKLEPQAQLIYQHNRVSNANVNNPEGNSTEYSFGDSNTFTGRIGGRLAFIDIAENDPNEQTDGFLRANLWHTFNGNSSISVVNSSDALPSAALGQTWIQLGGGISSKFDKDFSLFGGLDYNRAINGRSGSSISGRVGAKFSF